MKSTALIVVALAGAVALALSVATGAWASSTTTTPPSTSKVYQTYISSVMLPSPSTILATPLPVGDYLVQVAIGLAPVNSGVTISCNLETTGNTDSVTASTSGATDLSELPTLPVSATLAIDGTVVITQSHDEVDVACTYYGSAPTTAGASLTAEPVGKIKLGKGG